MSMKETPGKPSPGISSLFTLARARWRQHWLLLLLITLGMLVSIALACTIPLLSEVLQTAGLRTALTSPPENAELAAHVTTPGLSNPIINDIFSSIDSPFQKNIGRFLAGPPRLEVQTPDFGFVSPTPPSSAQMSIFATSMPLSASHVTLLQGRLPLTSSDHIEIAITPETAKFLGVKLNDVITLEIPFFIMVNGSARQLVPAQQPLTFHIVGIFHVVPHDPYWHDVDYLPIPPSDMFPVTVLPALASGTTLLAAFDAIAAKHQESQLLFGYPSFANWYYQLAPSHISTNQLDTLIASLASVQVGISENFANRGLSYYLSGAAFHARAQSSLLEQFRTRLGTLRVPVGLLTGLIITLLLFFISVMIVLLVDRQAETIVVLRGRGASNVQIFVALLAQCISLCIVALVAGLLLTLLLLPLVVHLLLGDGDQGALAQVKSAPVAALWSVRYYALITTLVAIIVMSLSLLSIRRLNLIAANNASERRARLPLWRRLNLDLLAVLVALVGYGLSIYLGSIQQQLDVQIQALVVTPLAFIGPFFLLLAVMLLLMRVFPWLLRWGARLAARGCRVTPLLALAQISRAPRKSLRMILLLALTIAFAIFSLVFAASQEQRSSDIAAFESGADFSGDIATSGNTQQATLNAINSSYAKLPGVISTSGGYNGDGIVTIQFQDTHIAVRAVDANTFAQTAIWTAQDSSQSLASLMNLLVARRQAAIAQDQVPVIMDAAMASSLNLQVGSKVSVQMSNLPDYAQDSSTSTLNCVVIAEVQHIPTVNAGTTLDGSGSTITIGGGMLLDYTTFARVYQTNNSLNLNAPALTPSMQQLPPKLLAELLAQKKAVLPVNHIWLHTQDDEQTLATARAALSTSPLRLTNLFDRRALQDTLNAEPLYLDLLTLLTIGTTITLLLVLTGYVLASWQNAKLRSGSFVTLRSLGASSLQVAGQFLLEQGFVFVVALLIGLVLGSVLSATVVPTLVFSDIPISGILSNLSDSQFYAIQQAFPRQVVIPSTLGIALALFAGIGILALGTMVRTVMRPALGQAIRLNED